MRRISIDSAEPGMINARNIYNSEGKTLLAAGVTLNDLCISYLKEFGIFSIYIRDHITDELVIPDTVTEKTRIESIKVVRQAFKQAKLKQPIDISPIRITVDKILEEILFYTNNLIQLVDIRPQNDYIFAHSVNVCILSLITGISLSYNTLQLKELGIGALLHDIGSCQVPQEILNKPGPLTDKELQKIHKHPLAGFNILRQIPEFPTLSCQIALEHHERLDGSGYPQQLRGKNIHEYAQIVSVTDVYDALLSYRNYRPAFLQYSAVQELTRNTYTLYNPHIVSSFLENIAIYPIGTIVQLNTKEIGIVVDVNKRSQFHPVVHILQDTQGEFKGTEIDLDKTEDIYIVKTLDKLPTSP